MVHLAVMYNGFSIKYISIFSFGVVILLFVVLVGNLYKQNLNYKDENRKLILQNDSILSVNLELIQAIEKNVTRVRTNEDKAVRFKK
jgi:hypothetical protein